MDGGCTCFLQTVPSSRPFFTFCISCNGGEEEEKMREVGRRSRFCISCDGGEEMEKTRGGSPNRGEVHGGGRELAAK